MLSLAHLLPYCLPCLTIRPLPRVLTSVFAMLLRLCRGVGQFLWGGGGASCISNGARQVAWVLRGQGDALPWYRVINAQRAL